MRKNDKAPAHLTPESQRLWREIRENYTIDMASAMILLATLEARDRREQARAAMVVDGAVVQDRFDQWKPSPWAAIERDSTLAMMRGFRLLGMDLSAASHLDRS